MAPIAASLIAPVASSLLAGIFGKGVNETEKRQKGRIIPLIEPKLLNSIFGKEVTRGGRVLRAGRGYNNVNQMYKSL